MPWCQWPQRACAGLRRVSERQGAVAHSACGLDLSCGGRQCLRLSSPRHASIALRSRLGLEPQRRWHRFPCNNPLLLLLAPRPLPAGWLWAAQPRQLHPPEIPGQQVCLQQLQLGSQLRPGRPSPTTCFQKRIPPNLTSKDPGEESALPRGSVWAPQPLGRAGQQAALRCLSSAIFPVVCNIEFVFFFFFLLPAPPHSDSEPFAVGAFFGFYSFLPSPTTSCCPRTSRIQRSGSCKSPTANPLIIRNKNSN